MKTIISFQCDLLATIDDVKPNFISFDDGIYSFDVMTPLACTPSLVIDCQAFDSRGQKYDLSPLTRTDGYWVPFSHNGTEKMFINVCRAVNGSDCSGEFVRSF